MSHSSLKQDLTKVAILQTSIVENMSPYINNLMNCGYECHIIETDKFSEKEKERVIKECQEKNIKNVMAFDMEQLEMMGAVNEAICPYASKKYVINLIKNKYVQREIEANPEMWYKPVYLSEKDEDILKKPREYPCMLKATAFYLGYYVFKIENEEDLKKRLEELRNIPDFNEYCEENTRIMNEFPDNSKPNYYPPLLLEKKFDINSLSQLSVDVFIDENQILVINCRDTIYTKSGLKIGILWPPFEFTKEDARIVEDFCLEIGKKLKNLGLKNHAFNMEIFYTREKKAFLTEINMLFNFNYVHVMDLLENENYLKLCFDVQLKKEIDPLKISFKKFLNNGASKWCFQSAVNVFHGGYTENFIDFNYINKLDLKTHRFSVFHGEGKYIPSERIGITGHYCVEVWFVVDKEEELYEYDKKLKSSIFKISSDIDRFVYPSKNM